MPPEKLCFICDCNTYSGMEHNLLLTFCRCSLVDLMVEMDRLLRPEGTVVVRDSPEVIEKVDRIARAVRWKSSMQEKEPESNGREKILVATKTSWKLPSSSH